MTAMHPTPWPRRRFLAATAAAAGGMVASPAWAQFRVEIAGIGATQIPLAVVSFRDETNAAGMLSDVVRADLLRSGLFRLVEAPEVMDERSLPVLADWRARGADALVAGSVSRLGDGRFDVRYKLWDAVKGEELVGKSQTVLPADLRLAAHRVADEIYENLTG